jgi:hypothetical protein
MGASAASMRCSGVDRPAARLPALERIAARSARVTPLPQSVSLHVTSTVAEVARAPPHTFLDWATDNAAEFLWGTGFLAAPWQRERLPAENEVIDAHSILGNGKLNALDDSVELVSIVHRSR